MEPTVQGPQAAEAEPAWIGPAGAGPESAGGGIFGPGCGRPGLSGHETCDRDTINAVQRTAGNEAAVSLLEQGGEIRAPRASAWARSPLLKRALVARQAGGMSVPVALQRAIAVQRDAAVIDGTSVSTYADLDKWYGERIKRLQAQRDDLVSGGLPSPAAVQAAISSAESAQTACRDDPSGALDGLRAIGAQAWLDNDYKKANNAAEAARGSTVANRLGTLNGAMRKAESSLRSDVLPELREKQHAAYMKDNSEGLVATADAIATVVDTALVLKDGITEASKTQKELVSIVNVALMNQGHPPPLNASMWVIRIGAAIEAANKAWAGIQLVRAGLDLAAGGKTGAAKSSAAVKGMATVISAGGTLLGASTGMTIYANLYIGPAVDECLKALEKLRDVGRKINRELMENGLYDKVNWDLEPGGRAMFDFMRAVMKAGSAGAIPDPIPPAVASYMGENAEELAAGAKAEEMETTGFWLWKKADPKWAKYWILRNRDSLWGMFYGSLPVLP